MRVLVVDDEIAQRSELEAVLLGWGASVVTAQNGLDALRQLNAVPVDAIIMGLRLPEIDGLAAARVIVELTGRIRRPHMIAIAPNGAYPRLAAAREARIFDAILTGPWDCAVVLETLERCVAARRAGQDPAADSASPPGTARLGVLSFRPAAGGAAAPAGPASVTSTQRVLVADDDAMVRSALQATLAAAGYDVDVADDGLAALRALAAQRYDLVLLDYQMPEIDGLAAGRVIADVIPPELRPHLIALTSAPEQLQVHEYGSWSVFDQVIPKSDGLSNLLTAARTYLDYRPRHIQ